MYVFHVAYLLLPKMGGGLPQLGELVSNKRQSEIFILDQFFGDAAVF